ncbi:calcium-activated chloride channel regulator 1-like [Daphnia carinata]|uniref:calcium-activated chloride channel regulator 1-like n=1 Tax=Daphnia carinata TaxID=120202 RepID=UPI00257E293F|nr:calcium-activated chloride channel regulator 1-like [Daphnia carinata]
MASITWCIFSLLGALTTTSAMLTFHQGGYNQLQVALNPHTPAPANCSQMFHHLEMVIRESSRLLHQATDGRAFIRTVSVVVPTGWGVDVSSMCGRNVSRTRLESYDEADVRVSALPHPLFTGGADVLWTQQSRDCGQPGDYISAGPDFFFKPTPTFGTNVSDVWIRGRRFLREFAKYRYGVFDLNERVATQHDGLFPDFFCPSASSASNATGRSIQANRWGCDNSSNENCINGTTQSPSFMTATAFCDASSHDDMAPTQHNLLCLGQSVRDVVFAHQDLKTMNAPMFNRLETIFNYKQAALPRYVLALDKSSPMDERDHWKYVRSATRRLVLHDLADETELGILSFAESVQIHTDGQNGPMVRLGSPGSREQVASAIPVFITMPSSGATGTGSVQESCLTCALAEAIAMLERGGASSAGDVIVLITTGSSSADQVQSALALASRKQVRVSVVAFAYVPTPGTHRAGALRNLQSLAEATGGRMTAVASKGVGTMSHISMLIELGDALLTTLEFHQGSDNVPTLVHEQEFGSESASGWVNGTFYMDPSLGRDTVMAVYFYSRDFNTHVGDIRLVSPDGVEHRGISETAMASLYVTPLEPIEKSGVWRYSFDRRSQSHQSHFVKVTSKQKMRSSAQPQLRGPLTAKLRIIPPAVGDAPFILLATVKSGEFPVLDARVRAIIQFTGTPSNLDSTSNNTMVVDLFDNGNADPDITRGDGVYSRYFGKYFRGAGTYSVTLSVDAMDGRAYTIRTSPSSKQIDAVECCGSVIRVPLERRELTGAFSRLVPGGIISAGSSQFGSSPSATTNATLGQIAEALDILPPSRVTDLRVHVEPTTQRITFQWTAVGDDFDIGTAYTYELRMASNKTWLKSQSTFQQAETLPAPTPRSSGDAMDLTLMDFDRYDRWFYAAIRAVDRRGNRGRISNLVQLWMPSPPTTTTTPAPVWPATSLSVNDVPPQWFNGGGLSTVHWAAIVAGICVALLILVLAVYFVVAAKRRKDKEQNSKSGPPKFAYVPTTVSSTLYPTPETKSASTTDLAIQDQNKEILSQYQSGAVTIYDGRTVPVHWSASQLLQEHERRHSPCGQNEPSDHFSAPNDSAFISGSYHLNSGSAIYGGMIHPDQQNIYTQSSSSATPPSADYRPYSVDYEGSSSVEQDGGYGYPTAHNNNTKSRPPTFPKPTSVIGNGTGRLMSHLPLHGSFTSLASERKKRNVTQV